MEYFIVLIFKLVTFWLANSYTSNAEEINPGNFKHYLCYRTEDQMIIDGKLDEDAWKKAAATDKFIDIEGNHMPAPMHDTHVKMLWDDKYLYIGAHLDEPHIWATYTERESIIFHENDFEIFIDPNGDTHNYYEIEVNALNTIWDLLLTKPYRDRGKPVHTWNVEGMKSAVFLKGTINDPSDTDEYWTVEFALPWNSLKEYALEQRIPRDGEQWRINFSRVQWKRDIVNGQYQKQIDPKTKKPYPEYNWVWSPQGVINMHYPESWGYLQFTDLPVGTKTAVFTLPEEEWTKWELRKVYYAQKEHFNKFNRYEKNHEIFLQSMNACKDPSFKIQAGEQEFEAELSCNESSKKWFIRKDGLVWSE